MKTENVHHFTISLFVFSISRETLGYTIKPDIPSKKPLPAPTHLQPERVCHDEREGGVVGQQVLQGGALGLHALAHQHGEVPVQRQVEGHLRGGWKRSELCH